jgi:hypothetical protein
VITALLSVVIVLLLLVLLLLVGVIRRLQAHEAVLSGSQTSMGDNSSVRPAFAVPDFTTTGTDGRLIDNNILLTSLNERDELNVVFFSTACEHCNEYVVDLGRRLRTEPTLKDGLFVVVFDDAEDDTAFRAQLEGQVRLAVRPVGDPMIMQFGVSALPRVHTYRANGALRQVTSSLDEVVPAPA